MSRKRSDIEILAEILRVAIDGAKKSTIVYRANLNFKVVKRYLKRLHESGLILFPSNNKRLFMTTPKGIEYIKQYKNLTSYIRENEKSNLTLLA